MDQDLVTIDYDEVMVDRDDLMAILFRIDEDEVWVPRSLIEDMDDQSFDVPEWFAIKEGLI